MTRLAEKEVWEQAVNRSRGGRTSRIHCPADDRGRAIVLALTPGTIAGISVALPLLGVVTKSRRLIGGEAHDIESLRRWLKELREGGRSLLG